jgi:GDPmannose 4,6-dehydratase
MKISLIVGAAGQDGTLLSALLRARGDEVIGLARAGCKSSQRGELPPVDIVEREQVARLLREQQPDEIYYLAGAQHSAESVERDPYQVLRRANDVHVTGLANFLDGAERYRRSARLFYAASSHVFGNPAASPQNERTPLAPVCLYGITKAAGIGLCRFYRANRGLHCSAGILYNHESPLRTLPYVSRRIVDAAVDIKLGAQHKLVLGNLSAGVDWGAAEDYVDAMARILQLERPEDFVVASGNLHTVGQFVEAAFTAAGLPWQPHVTEDAKLLNNVRPTVPLTGNAARLREATGWRPSLDFAEMVRRMVRAGLESRAPARS